ncbi:MAG: YggS family pyridoxal phosphate-dependent enzyme [Bythopirellula sp.]|nr:YggS family pyridoxal phosphate-dependent enzyme [Bythopirellula sp.]
MNTAQLIADNLARVHERIADAAHSVGRSPDEVQLVAVSKYVGVAETAALLAAGCPILGESRPQQLWDKAAEPTLAGAQWHLIGHLQRNKVRRTVAVADLIHSVDSLRLLETINECAAELNRPTRVLLEVNCSGDAAKHGLSAEELRRILPEFPRLEHVTVCGLMTMAALEGGETVAATNFASLRELRDAVQPECPPGVTLSELSMGMSHDFEAAIREGATLVRVGSLLF